MERVLHKNRKNKNKKDIESVIQSVIEEHRVGTEFMESQKCHLLMPLSPPGLQASPDEASVAFLG